LNKIQNITVTTAVALSGMIVMIFEIVGARIMASYAGTTTFVWAAIIGIIMSSLSIGFWLGGKATKKGTTVNRLALFLTIAACFIGISAWLHKPILELLSSWIISPETLSIVASVILFAPASIFLGIVLPYSVGLRVSNVENAGKTVGKLYAKNTIGSIIGTFLAGFYLIPNFGSTNIIFVLAIIICIMVILLYLSVNKYKRMTFPLILSLLFLFLVINKTEKKSQIIDKYQITNPNHQTVFQLDF